MAPPALEVKLIVKAKTGNKGARKSHGTPKGRGYDLGGRCESTFRHRECPIKSGR
jgi:hypothetical protein